MRVLITKGKLVKVKCESDADWRELVKAIPAESLNSSPGHIIKKFLIELKNGMMTLPIKRAIEKNWILDEDTVNQI